MARTSLFAEAIPVLYKFIEHQQFNFTVSTVVESLLQLLPFVS